MSDSREMGRQSVAANIDEYMAGFPENVQEMMRTLREAIHEAVPGLTEKISWAMPTFAMKKIVVQFAGFKNHIGFFPGPDAIVHFADELKGYTTSKGGIHLPYSGSVPVELVKAITAYNAGKLQNPKA